MSRAVCRHWSRKVPGDIEAPFPAPSPNGAADSNAPPSSPEGWLRIQRTAPVALLRAEYLRTEGIRERGRLPVWTSSEGKEKAHCSPQSRSGRCSLQRSQTNFLIPRAQCQETKVYQTRSVPKSHAASLKVRRSPCKNAQRKPQISKFPVFDNSFSGYMSNKILWHKIGECREHEQKNHYRHIFF